MAKFNLNNESFGMKERPAPAAAGTGPSGFSGDTETFCSVDKGKKGKAPMMNIRFTPENYDYMRRESAVRGLSVTGFVNWIIDAYKADPDHVHENPVYGNPEKW